MVGIYDTLQDGEDIDGIGVDNRNRWNSGIQDLDFEVALQPHRQVGSAFCRCEISRSRRLDFLGSGRWMHSTNPIER